MFHVAYYTVDLKEAGKSFTIRPDKISLLYVCFFDCRKRSKRSGVELVEEETVSPHTHPDTVGGALHGQGEGDQGTGGREEGEEGKGVNATPRKKYHLNRSSTVATPTTGEGIHNIFIYFSTASV